MLKAQVLKWGPRFPHEKPWTTSSNSRSLISVAWPSGRCPGWRIIARPCVACGTRLAAAAASASAANRPLLGLSARFTDSSRVVSVVFLVVLVLFVVASSAARFFPAPRSYAPGPSSSSDDNRAESAPSPPVAPCCSSTASRRPAQRSSLFHATPTPPRYWRAPCAVPQSSWNAEAMSSTVIFAMVFIFVSPLLFAVASSMSSMVIFAMVFIFVSSLLFAVAAFSCATFS